MNSAELTGRARTHIVEQPEFGCALHKNVVVPFTAMRRAALADGFDLVPASGFRDFTRQMLIWNEKYAGERPVYDAAGARLDVTTMSAAARVEAILLWSAIPGASRHHWGTDLDLFDRGAAAAGHTPRLTPDEYADGGPFAGLGVWLERHAARYGFFRPYRGGVSAVHSEPWHYSFAPLADGALRDLSAGVLREAISLAPLAGKPQVLARLDDLHARYVARIDPF